MVLVHRGRNGDGEEGAVAQALGIGGDLEPRGFQLVLGDLAGRVIARREAFDAALVHVEADDVIEMLGEGDGQGQADVAQSDHGDSLAFAHAFLSRRYFKDGGPGARKSTRMNSRPECASRMPSSACTKTT